MSNHHCGERKLRTCRSRSFAMRAMREGGEVNVRSRTAQSTRAWKGNGERERASTAGRTGEPRSMDGFGMLLLPQRVKRRAAVFVFCACCAVCCLLTKCTSNRSFQLCRLQSTPLPEAD